MAMSEIPHVPGCRSGYGCWCSPQTSIDEVATLRARVAEVEAGKAEVERHRDNFKRGYEQASTRAQNLFSRATDAEQRAASLQAEVEERTRVGVGLCAEVDRLTSALAASERKRAATMKDYAGMHVEHEATMGALADAKRLLVDQLHRRVSCPHTGCACPCHP